MMSVGPHIQRAIELVGSQPKLAEASGLSQQHISNLLKGHRRPSAEAAIAISKATGGRVPIADLIPGVFEAVAAEIGSPAAIPDPHLPPEEVA